MKIVVGQDSCGIAAGAGKIYDYFKENTPSGEEITE